jgi:hypothetical protein
MAAAIIRNLHKMRIVDRDGNKECLINDVVVDGHFGSVRFSNEYGSRRIKITDNELKMIQDKRKELVEKYYCEEEHRFIAELDREAK